MSRTAALFLNGSYSDNESRLSLIDPDTLIIGVDGGTRYLISANLIPHAVIGDMDSLSEPEIRAITGHAVNILTYPTDKDQTDFELAIDYAIHQGCAHILVFGGLFGRIDHMLANLFLPLALNDQLSIHFIHGKDEVLYVHKKATIHGSPGDIVTLLPINGMVQGVQTAGLHYPLNFETLYPGKSRGVSNYMEKNQAVISVKSGVLLCIHLSIDTRAQNKELT